MYPYIVNDPFWDPISGIPHETMGHLRESLASKDPAPEKMSLSLSRACPKVLLRMVFSQSPNIYWLVVLTILKNMKVSWGYYSQYMEKVKKCSKPPDDSCWGQFNFFTTHSTNKSHVLETGMWDQHPASSSYSCVIIRSVHYWTNKEPQSYHHRSYRIFHIWCSMKEFPLTVRSL